MEVNNVHKYNTTLIQGELVKNELSQIELQYNALTQQKSNELLKENQELKLELSGYRQAILNNKEMLGLKEQNEELKKQLKDKTEDYKRMKDNFDSKVDVLTKIETQQKELKQQLEEYIKQNMKLKDELFDKRKEYQDTYKDVRLEIKEYKTQQKEFIKYLEDMLDYENDLFSVVRVKDVLQKYKEIIGDDK